jgi:hypothetical protein
MKIIFGKFVKTSSEAFFRIGDTFKKVDAIKVKIKGYEDVEFFAFKEKKGSLEFWNIIEAVSGCKLANSHPSLIKVKKRVEENLALVSRSKFESKISMKIRNLYLSPAYRTIVNPNRIFYVKVKKFSVPFNQK